MSFCSMSWHRRKAGDRRCVRVEVVLRNVVFFSSSASKWQTDRFCFAELKRRKKWNWNCFYLSVVFPPFFAKVKREKVICATKKKTILFVTKIILKSSPGTDVIKLFIFQSTCDSVSLCLSMTSILSLVKYLAARNIYVAVPS